MMLLKQIAFEPGLDESVSRFFNRVVCTAWHLIWYTGAMAHGGKRPGAGRPLGSKSKRTLQLQEKARELGVCPAEAMMLNIKWAQEQLVEENHRGFSQVELRDMIHKNAKDLAPYLYPKLANTHLETNEDREIRVVINK